MNQLETHYRTLLTKQTLRDSNTTSYFISKVWGELISRVIEADGDETKIAEQRAFFAALADLNLPSEVIETTIRGFFYASQKPQPMVSLFEALQDVARKKGSYE